MIVLFCVFLILSIACVGDALYDPCKEEAWWWTGLFGVSAAGAVVCLIKLV